MQPFGDGPEYIIWPENIFYLQDDNFLSEESNNDDIEDDYLQKESNTKNGSSFEEFK